MVAFLTILILLLAAIGNFIHALASEPASDAFLSPKVKAGLTLAALFLAILLPQLQEVVKTLKAPPLAMFLMAVFLTLCSGCAWLKSNKTALEPLEDDACALGAMEAGMSPAAAAGFCHLAVDYVNSLAAKKAEHRARAIAALHPSDAGADR